MQPLICPDPTSLLQTGYDTEAKEPSKAQVKKKLCNMFFRFYLCQIAIPNISYTYTIPFLIVFWASLSGCHKQTI